MRACPLISRAAIVARMAKFAESDDNITRRRGKTIGDDAADQQRGDLSQCPAGEGDTDIGRGPRQVENGERDRDRREIRPEERDRSRRGEQAEVPLAERA